MSVRKANAVWEDNLKQGKGRIKLGSSNFEGSYSFSSRFEQGHGTNPEELIGAAHAGCFSMALAHALAESGYKPLRISTEAKVSPGKDNGGLERAKAIFYTQADYTLLLKLLNPYFSRSERRALMREKALKAV